MPSYRPGMGSRQSVAQSVWEGGALVDLLYDYPAPSLCLLPYDYRYQIAGCQRARCNAPPQYACQLALDLAPLHMHQAGASCFIASDTEYIIPVRARLPLCV